MGLFSKLYRKFVSKEVRDVIYRIFLGSILEKKRTIEREWKWKYWHWVSRFRKGREGTRFAAWCEWGSKPLSPYPYTWELDYKPDFDNVMFSEEQGLFYVNHRGKKLFFPKSMGAERVAVLYRSLLVEQDARSAHKYIDDTTNLLGVHLIDVGAAEGIFTLENIEIIDKATLFECDPEWTMALQATFYPYRDKVQIVNKYVGKIDGDDFTTLDSYFGESARELLPETKLFVKMDIEGYERDALVGAETIMKRNDIHGSICIYHLGDDEKVITSNLRSKGLDFSIVSGYIFFGNEMRHAIVRF